MLASAENMLKPGDSIAGYTVERLLGKGGMGAVYLAKSQSTGGRYAVKILFPPEEDGRSEWRKRFAHEAEFAMKVKHKNLVAVHAAGEDPETGLCYIVMDYVSGGTLSERIADSGRIGMREAVDIVVQLADVLEVAHRAGVVHRDIKPDNIMFGADGTPKLADLGVAKFSHSGTQTTTLTSTGAMIGTPAYMSPEQMMNSHAVDGRADIYSLGLVLYEMLAGERPNHDSTVVELLAKAVNGEEMPDIRSIRPEVSAALAYVISRMVSSKPDDRPPSVATVAELLESALTGKIKVPREYRRFRGNLQARRKARRMVMAAAAIVMLAATALLSVWIVARKTAELVPLGVDSITAQDINDLVSQVAMDINRAAAKGTFARVAPNVRAVIRILPVEIPELSSDKRGQAVADELGTLLAQAVTESGQLIVYDNGSSASTQVMPQYLLKSRLSIRQREDNDRETMEVNLSLTIVDVAAGLQVWHKRIPLMKSR